MTITLTREEAQQVLDALVFATPSGFGPAEVYKDAVVLLQNRLAQPEPEPVATVWVQAGDIQSQIRPGLPPGTKLYTAPPQREWVGIEDEEIRRTDHHRVDGAYDYSFKQGARWAEAKLKEKNT